MINSMQVKSLGDDRLWGCSYMFSHYPPPKESTESLNVMLIYDCCGIDVAGRRVLERLIATWHLRLRYSPWLAQCK